jgi:excisionase family DNA binding protein
MYPQTTLSHARDLALLHVGSASHPAARSRLEADDPSQLTDRCDFSHAASCALPPGGGSLSSVGKVCHPLLRRSSLLMTDEILTLPEVAKLLKVTDKSVYSLAQKGTLPGFKVGGQWRFKRVDIDAWIEEQKATVQGREGGKS